MGARALILRPQEQLLWLPLKSTTTATCSEVAEKFVCWLPHKAGLKLTRPRSVCLETFVVGPRERRDLKIATDWNDSLIKQQQKVGRWELGRAYK